MQERDMTTETITDDVRDRYAAAARAVLDPSLGRSDAATSCCAPDGTAAFGEILYDADQRAGLPEAAVLASLGCGNPTAVAELHDGETVLDLGSGGGIDVLLSAQRVGPNGFVYGLDMTDEMLELARRNAVAAGATNVEFRKGRIESIPLGDGAVDVVISNCVVNLSTDKAAVLAEEDLPTLVAAIFPWYADEAVTIAEAIRALSRPIEMRGQPAYEVRLNIRDGVVNVGLIPILTIPSVGGLDHLV
jgi:SAM-dependent methyltransferase